MLLILSLPSLFSVGGRGEGTPRNMAKRASVPWEWDERGSQSAFQPQATSGSDSGLIPDMHQWLQGPQETNELTNSKDNTDPNQSETPVERLRAGTQGTPWGPPAGADRHGSSQPTLGCGRCRARTRVPLGLPLAREAFPYFPCTTPNHDCSKHLLKKLMGVTWGGNSVKRHGQRRVLRKEDDFKGKREKT